LEVSVTKESVAKLVVALFFSTINFVDLQAIVLATKYILNSATDFV